MFSISEITYMLEFSYHTTKKNCMWDLPMKKESCDKSISEMLYHFIPFIDIHSWDYNIKREKYFSKESICWG